MLSCCLKAQKEQLRDLVDLKDTTDTMLAANLIVGLVSDMRTYIGLAEEMFVSHPSNKLWYLLSYPFCQDSLGIFWRHSLTGCLMHKFNGYEQYFELFIHLAMLELIPTVSANLLI